MIDDEEQQQLQQEKASERPDFTAMVLNTELSAFAPIEKSIFNADSTIDTSATLRKIKSANDYLSIS